MGHDSTPLTVELAGGWEATAYREWSFPRELPGSWDALAKAYGDLGVFLSFENFSCWWRSFGAAARPLVTVLSKGGKPMGIFPCQLVQEGTQQRSIRSLTNNETHCYDFLVAGEERPAALSGFLLAAARLFPAESITIEKMPAQGPNTGPLLELLARRGGRFHQSFHPTAPWLEVPQSEEELLGRLSGRVQKSLRQSRKRGAREGRIWLQAVTGNDSLEATLSEVFEVEYRGWKGEAGTAIKCRHDAESYYRGVARWALESGALVLFLLRLDQCVTAACFCLVRGNTLFILKTGYDEKYRHLTPGLLLLAEVLTWCRETGGYSVCDLCGGCEPWKMEWTGRTGASGMITIYPASFSGTLEYFRNCGWKLFLKKFRLVQYGLDLLRRDSAPSARSPQVFP
ncbi:GNAT family N-acetyltransferase [Geomonas agri]|uniref:GNAT family N-acetyltransferase n=1 Tax=Geomonas agri TaxID=2873702 RepID=UPI001CD7AF0A|nr:GNAT family N-acetyltransferase [Geomonas agri]